MSVSIQKALKTISKDVLSVSTEIIPIENSKTRILAEDIYANIAMPTFHNSAMDGYAVKIKDANKEVKIQDLVLAGCKNTPNFIEGQCIKIMTGARVPTSTEAIIPKELVTQIDHETILLPNKIIPKQHIRFIGEDIKKGEKLLLSGVELNFSSITILASQGISHVKVYRKPKVSIFTSGEELKAHYETIEDYQLYNSNTPSLLARAEELGADVIFTGMAKDNIQSLKELITNSLHCDLIITSGGISVGDADFTREAFDAFDIKTLIEGITIKPGKPTIFSKINNTYVLNLPGNPLAASLIFEVFGKIIMQELSGSKDVYHNTLLAKIGEDLKNKKGRTTIIPGFFDGEYFIASQKRAAGMVGVLHKCNSLVILDAETEYIKKETTIKILPINWKFFTDKEKNYLN